MAYGNLAMAAAHLFIIILQTSSQAHAKVTLCYLGPDFFKRRMRRRRGRRKQETNGPAIGRELSLTEVSVEQQACRGNPVLVFKDMLRPGGTCTCKYATCMCMEKVQ